MLLAIDTATRLLSIALFDGRQIHAESTWQTANQHTIELMPAIESMMQRIHLTVDRLTLLAVSQGPGSFNGLRIGFSVTKGLAFARKIPLVTVPTLDLIAAAHPPIDGTLLAVVQAGRGRVCAQRYHWQGTWQQGKWQPDHDTQIVSWRDLMIAMPSDRTTLISGEIDQDGHLSVEQAIIEGRKVLLAAPALSLRRAGFLAQLAWERWQAQPMDEAMTATPLYLHQPGVPHP